MTVNSDLISTGRQIRTAWREEEEAFIEESSHYSRKQITFLEYLSSIAHAGHNVCVSSSSCETIGTLAHLGQDYFSVSPSNNQGSIYSYSSIGFSKSLIEVDVLEKESRSWRTALYRLEKNFYSLIDELSVSNKKIEIETALDHVHTGQIQMLGDSVIVMPEDFEKEKSSTMVVQGASLIPIEAIVSIAYSI